MICDITTSFGADPGPICNFDHGLFSEIDRHVVSSSKTFEINNICIFIDSGFFYEGEGIDAILRKCNQLIYFLQKTHIRNKSISLYMS